MLAGLSSSIHSYLFLSLIFFVCGIICMLSRKNLIALLMGVELILNSAALNFVAFQSFRKTAIDHPWVDGYIFSLFIVVLAAIEAAVAFAVVIRLFSHKRNINAEMASELRG